MGDMRSAVAEAMESFDDEGTAEAEAPEVGETPTPDASTGGELEVPSDDGPDTSETPEPEAASVGTDDEVPSEYFGLDLSSLEPSQRVGIIDELKKRDDHIGKLLRERAEEGSVSTEPEESVPEQPELSDEEILQRLGLDPENNPFDEQAAKVALPLVRRQLAQEQALASLIETQELAEIDREWRTSLSALERQYGALPREVDHDAVMEYAAENSIASPQDAYWRVVGPARAALTDAMKAVQSAQVQQKQQAKKDVASVRPAAVEAEDDAPIKAGNVKGAAREVAQRLLSDLGLDS